MMPAITELMLAVSSSPAASIAAKATAVLALGLTCAWAARRNKAAIRHALLAAALGVLPALPIAALVAPPVRIALWKPARVEVARGVGAVPRAAAARAATEGLPGTARSSGISLADGLLAGWIAGVALFLLPVMAGLWQVRSLRRSSVPWPHGRSMAGKLAAESGVARSVEVLLNGALPGPMTCGMAHPAIVLPRDAQNWQEEDLNRAIVHELEHVRRGDWLSQCLARVVCAVYWFHPLVWVAWRRLALEAERSCDDAVVGRSEATAYADQLVGLARRLSMSMSAKSPLLAMANRADLSARVGALLDAKQRRGRAGRFAVTLACTAAAALVLGIAPLRMVAAPQSAAAPEISARFRSASNLVMVDVAVADASGNPVEGLTAKDFAIAEDGAPESISLFQFEKLKDDHNLTSSYYILGYYTHNQALDGRYRKIQVTVNANNLGKLDYRAGYYANKILAEGAIKSVVTAAPGAGPGITPPLLISKTEPAYSEEARKAKYQGTVFLSIEVDDSGLVTDVKVVRSLGLGLDEKAIEAVRKWKFKPAMQNARPVAVRTQVEVEFRLL